MPTVTYTTLNDPLGIGSSGTSFVGIPESGTDVVGISPTTGQIAGLYVGSDQNPHGFLYNGSTYTSINDPLATSGTAAWGVNDSGQIVGTFSENHSTTSFLFSGGIYTTLSDPLATGGNTAAIGINNSGQVVGSYTDTNFVFHAFLFSGGTYTTIDDPLAAETLGNGTSALGINSLGQVVGTYTDSGSKSHGYLFSGGSYTTIDDPLGVGGTIARGINDSGQIVGTYKDGSGVYHGFLFSNGTYTTIDDPLAVVGTGFNAGGTEALGIDNAGDIVGSYLGSDGLMHGFTTGAGTSAPPPTTVQQEDLGLYMALYNRAAEFPGYSFWIGTVAQQPDGAGVTIANAGSTAVTLNDAAVLGQDFVNTQATFFNQTYASLNDSQFINALYVNIGGNAGDPGGIAFWANLLAQAEAGGESVQAARAGLAGQFVHDLIDVNLAAFTTLTPAQLLAAEQRQETINNKITVSLAYTNASQGPGGAILDPQTIGDAAYNAATTVLQSVTFDPATVTAAITGINNAVAHQDLTLI